MQMCTSNKFWIITGEMSLATNFGAPLPHRRYYGSTMWRAVYKTLDEAKVGAARWLGNQKLPKIPPRICIVECNVVGYMSPPESPLPVYTPVEETDHA